MYVVPNTYQVSYNLHSTCADIVGNTVGRLFVFAFVDPEMDVCARFVFLLFGNERYRQPIFRSSLREMFGIRVGPSRDGTVTRRPLVRSWTRRTRRITLRTLRRRVYITLKGAGNVRGCVSITNRSVCSSKINIRSFETCARTYVHIYIYIR